MNRIDKTVTAATSAETGIPFDEPGLLNRLMGDRALAGSIVCRFVEQFPSQLRKLSMCLKDGDGRQAVIQAHTMKGAAACASAECLRSVASKAERAAAAGELNAAGELVSVMEEEFDRFKTALKPAAGGIYGTACRPSVR